MSRSQQPPKARILSVDVRPVRDVGGSYGFSVDLNALRDLGLVDDDGELVQDVSARQTVTADGKIELDLEGVDAEEN